MPTTIKKTSSKKKSARKTASQEDGASNHSSVSSAQTSNTMNDDVSAGEVPPPPPSKPGELFNGMPPISEAERQRMMEDAMNQESQEEPPPTLDELMYSVNSFGAVLWPVSLTMILSGLAVVYINQGNNGDGAGGVGSLPTPVIVSENASSGEQAFGAIINALAIIGVIVAVTFGMVALYYYNQIKILIGWLVISTSLLLGITTSQVANVFLFVYRIPADKIFFWFFFYNFAAVGILAIFIQKGLPRILNQAYVICISVTMAWLLIYVLPEWTSWALLVCLACYDLCAVLTPCGPLKCLVEMAQEKEDGLPGLLYEADVGYETPNQAGAVAPSSGDAQASASAEVSRSPIPPPTKKPSLVTDTSEGSTSTDSMDEGSMGFDRSMDLENPAPLPPAQPQKFDSDRSIKLGLGDFVFYSVLTGRAALYSFPTFVAVMITVLFGLASTLVLLSVFKKALPALPISIFLGVTFYFLTELCVTPFSNYLILDMLFV